MERPAETHLFGSRAGQSQPGTRLRCQSQSTWPTCKTGSEQTFTSLQRGAGPPLHRFSLQNMECISSLYSRLNKLPCECWQWVPKMAVWGCVFGRVQGVGGEGRREPKMINDQNLEEKTLQPICADFLLPESGENPWISQA